MFEDDKGIRYIYSAIREKETLPTQYGYELKGPGADNVLTEKVLTPEQIYMQWDGQGSWSTIGNNGISVIKFPVKAGCTYAVNANGSKMTATGFYFDTTGDATVTTFYGNENVVLLDEGQLPGVSHVLIGDVNDDGFVNISDVVCLVSYILGQNPSPFIYEAADVNEDSQINISDAVALVGLILN